MLHCVGQRAKRRVMMAVSVASSSMSKQNTAIESQYNHRAGYGNVWRSILNAPVPIVVVNHL